MTMEMDIETHLQSMVLMSWTWWLHTEKEVKTCVFDLFYCDWSALFCNLGLLANSVRSGHSFGVPSLFPSSPLDFLEASPCPS